MRRVSKSAYHPDRELMFSRGVERIIAQKQAQPTSYPDFELDAILRKERAAESHQAFTKQPVSAYVLVDFLQLLAWRSAQNRY